jgi:glutamate decarboxylase
LNEGDENPAVLTFHERCVSIIARLWGAQEYEKPVGSAMAASETIHLGGLAMKQRWKETGRSKGKNILKPNVVMGANAEVALREFAMDSDVEARVLPVSAKSNFRLDPELVRDSIDENTIGVVATMGSTYTGNYEPIEEISKILDVYQCSTGRDIPIHVNAASGGFIAPFTYAKAGASKW